MLIGFRLYWLLWLVVGFGIPEAFALSTSRPKETLSDTVWWICDITPGHTTWNWTFLHFLLAALLVWLLGHLVLGLWR